MTHSSFRRRWGHLNIWAVTLILARMARLQIELFQTRKMSGRLGDSEDGWASNRERVESCTFPDVLHLINIQMLMFSSTRSRFCTSLHWCSNQSSDLILQLPVEELARHSSQTRNPACRICQSLPFAVIHMFVFCCQGLLLLRPNSCSQVSSLDKSFLDPRQKVGFEPSETVAEHWFHAASPRIVAAALHSLWTQNVKRISLPLGAVTQGLKLGPLASSSRLWSFHTVQMSPVTRA